MQVILPNSTTMIIISNLHEIHLTLRDDGRWISACTTPPPSTVGKGTTASQASVGAPGDMTIA